MNYSTRHSLRRVVALTAAACALCAVASAQDLAIDSVSLNPGEAGNCNTVSLTIRNTSNQLINQITGAKVITFPTATPSQNRHEKSVFFSAIQANATMSRTVQGLELAGGQVQHTVQVVIDFQNQVAETNENNNIDTQFVTPSQTCGGGQCDLAAQSMNPFQSTIPSTYPVNLSVKFRNVGGAQCQASTIEFRRHSGSSASGPSEVIGTATIAASSPNQQRTAGITDNDHDSSGTFTYAYSWVGQEPDTNTSNNFLTKTVKFSGPSTGGRPTNPSGCDVSAQFVNPSGTSAAANTSVPFQVLFKNQGSATCITAKISLSRYNNASCSGYGSMVGGSGNFQTLNALSSGQQQTLTWTERRSPRGGYCYRMRYSPAFNDDDNGNHHPKKKVTFQ